MVSRTRGLVFGTAVSCHAPRAVRAGEGVRLGLIARRYRQLQRGIRSAEALTQRATFGAEQVASQRRPLEFMLHDVVPIALPTLVLLVVLVKPLASLSPLVLLLVVVLMLVLLLLTLLSMLMLLEVEAATAPVTAKHSRKARWGGNLMMRLQGSADDRVGLDPAAAIGDAWERIFSSARRKRGRSPFFWLARQVRSSPLYRCRGHFVQLQSLFFLSFLSLSWPFALPWPRLPGPSALISLLTEPALTAPVPPAPVPAAATPPRVVLVLLLPLAPAWVLLVVAVFCVALVLWLVVALGLMVTLLCGIALKVASVFTDVLALGATDWVALVLVVLLARFLVLPLLPDPVVDPVPAWVLLVVAVFWVADVVWLVVPLGLMVTVLCGIARKVASVLTEVLALGATDWVDCVLVSLVAVLLVCARAEPPVTAKATAAMRVSLFLIIGCSP